MGWILKLFGLEAEEPELNPEDYGWDKDRYFDENYPRYVKEGGWILYQSSTGWVLDKTPKHGPGVIARVRGSLTHSMMTNWNQIIHDGISHRTMASGAKMLRDKREFE